MSRINMSKKLRDVFNEKVNCINAIEFIDNKNIVKTDDELPYVIIEETPVDFVVIKYHDTTDDTAKNRKYIEDVFRKFDFMSFSNAEGYDYFPYLYGVLDCRNKEDSAVYTFYEYFPYSITHLVANISHASEWYDIVFQLSLLNYLLHKSDLKFDPSKIRYRRLEKPYRKEYEMDSSNLTIKKLFDISVVDYNIYDDKTTFPLPLEYLKQYINNNREILPIPPSHNVEAIIDALLSDIDNTYDILASKYT